MDAGFQSLRDQLMTQFKDTDDGLAGRKAITETTDDDAENAA